MRQLEIEKEAVKREKNDKLLKSIKKQIADAKEKRDEIKAAWSSEKEILDTIQNLKKEIEALETEADQAERKAF